MKLLVDGLLDLTLTRLGNPLPIKVADATMVSICEQFAETKRAYLARATGRTTKCLTLPIRPMEL
jgi:hypothetical protein